MKVVTYPVEISEDLLKVLLTKATEKKLTVPQLIDAILTDYVSQNLVTQKNNSVISYDLSNRKNGNAETDSNDQFLAEIQQFVEELREKYGDREPVNAVELVKEGRRG